MEPSPAGAAAEAFGIALRELREQAGLSLRELGRRALYDYTRLSRAEHGHILIPEEHVRILDEILHAGGLLTALRRSAGPGMAAGAVAGRCTVTDSDVVILEAHLPGGGSITMRLSRRQFGQLLAAGTLTAALPGAASPDDAGRIARSLDQPGRVDADVLGYFSRSLGEYYRADKMLGPRHLIGPVLAQISVLDSLRRDVKPAQADPLLRILAQYGEMAGWLLQDSGDLDAAAGWSRRAGEWAQCAGDANLAAYMLVRQANIAVLTGDHTAVVQLAAAARREPGRIDPKLAALALQQQARGHARLAEFSESFTLLDQAAATLTAHPDVTHPDVPVYLHNYDLATLREQTAGCHLEAGHASEAIAILTEAMAATAPSLTRDHGHLASKLAVAVIRAPQPDLDQASMLGLDALAVARSTGSARILHELAVLDREFRGRWPGHRGGLELHDQLVA
jgi:transcriptional regulator with XRE-family HTH domain/tetratricopeptide (TPR) repeat protein